MKRDFSESSKEQLLSLVKGVNNDAWYDGFRDIYYDAIALLGGLDASKYLDNMEKYHKRVIDKENLAEADIERIFNDVNTVSTNYCSRFTALFTLLDEYNRQLSVLTETINPKNGVFDYQYIKQHLNNKLSEYSKTYVDLTRLSREGLTEDVLKDTNPNILNKYLSEYIDVIIEMYPDIGLNEEVEIPIGPNTVVYYNVKSNVSPGEGVISDSFSFDEQRELIKKTAFEIKSNNMSGSIQSNENGETDLSLGTTLGDVTYKVDSSGYETIYYKKIGNNTVSCKHGLNVREREILFEYSVVTSTDAGEFSSAIGIKRKYDDVGWKQLPAYEEVTVPYPIKVPEFDIDWHASKDTVKGTVKVLGYVAVAALVCVIVTEALPALVLI